MEPWRSKKEAYSLNIVRVQRPPCSDFNILGYTDGDWARFSITPAILLSTLDPILSSRIDLTHRFEKENLKRFQYKPRIF